ncbi:MAG: chemotaxis response regulator protein-glutamate methylesterase [Deltaproteobacteria bacterium]|nr:MAG: chemotaxis response regulator protein-glutamate methylesterase [Deltaproteobacteria bacterium]
MKTRVLLIDDSVVVRKIVGDAVSSHPDLEVVGKAANGKLGLEMIPQVNPDVIVLDVEMPEMDGITTLREIRKIYKNPKVIMFSTLTQRGADITLEALSIGAVDYFAKPTNLSNVEEVTKYLKDGLVQKIKFLGPTGKNELLTAFHHPPQTSNALKSAPVVSSTTAQKVEIVAIGTSTGGPNALGSIFPNIPEKFPVPIVIVQHMPPVFTKHLADRLNSKSKVRVYEGTEGAILKPGEAWIAPGDFHMTVKKEGLNYVLHLNQQPPENSCRPAVDVLFRSVAEAYGQSALGIVLTGMGQDGFRGCENLTHVGSRAIVQDEASSVVWGMPGFVAKAGLAEKVLPLDQIIPEVVRRVSYGRL